MIKILIKFDQNLKLTVVKIPALPSTKNYTWARLLAGQEGAFRRPTGSGGTLLGRHREPKAGLPPSTKTPLHVVFGLIQTLNLTPELDQIFGQNLNPIQSKNYT